MFVVICNSLKFGESMKFKYLVIPWLVLFNLSSIALAGDGREEGGQSGGGGNAVVCRSNNEIKSVELLDLYEGRMGLPTNFIKLDPNQDIKKSFNIVLSKLGRGALNPNFIHELNNEFINLLNHLRPIPDDAELSPTNDVFEAFKPKNCTIEPVINYFSRNMILIDMNLYNKMDHINQVALMLHEALYLKEREQGVRDSRYVRQVVGEVMQEGIMHTSHLNLNAKIVQKCETKVTKRKSVFYITNKRTYYLSETQPINTIFFEKLNGHNLITYTGFNVDLESLGKDFEILRPMLTVDQDIKTNLELDLISQEGKLFLSYRGVSHDWFEMQEVQCQTIELNR